MIPFKIVDINQDPSKYLFPTRMLVPKFKIWNDLSSPVPLEGLNYFWDGELPTEESKRKAEECIRQVLLNVPSGAGARSAAFIRAEYPMRYRSAAFRDDIYMAGYNYVGMIPSCGPCVWGNRDCTGTYINESRALATSMKYAADMIAAMDPQRLDEVMWRLQEHLDHMEYCRTTTGNLSVATVDHIERRFVCPIRFIVDSKFGEFGTYRGMKKNLTSVEWSPNPEKTGIKIRFDIVATHLIEMYDIGSWKYVYF